MAEYLCPFCKHDIDHGGHHRQCQYAIKVEASVIRLRLVMKRRCNEHKLKKLGVKYDQRCKTL